MAYIAVTSLKNTIHRLINPTDPKITESAYVELDLLEDALKRFYSTSCVSLITAVDSEIRELVWKLEDVIKSLPSSDVQQKIEPFMEEVIKLGEKYNRELKELLPAGKYSTMVGLSDQFEKIRYDLVGGEPALRTISLFGMAGIGKTRLVREISLSRIIVEKFYIAVWATLGPEFDMKEVLVDILSQIERKSRDLYMEEDESTLRSRIYKGLFGRKYFIVLDDVWSKQAWDDLKMWFPAGTFGSRILLTTRLEEVARHPTKAIVNEMRLLKHEESWNLLYSNVLYEGGQSPSDQLEDVGREIAAHCEGLPLLILEVAKLLSRADKNREYWNQVAKKQNATFTDAYDGISKVLLSSYAYLPRYLKACFLYMGAFPRNYEVPLPKLMNLWAVEDILEPKESARIEDFAVECLKMLVSQSLVIVCKHSSNGKIKTCKLHSTYWHLCVIEARKNKFFHVLNSSYDGRNDYTESQLRLSIQNNILFGIKEVHSSMAAASGARSLLCTGPNHEYPVPICFDLMLLKVLDALAIRFYEFPVQLLKLLQLEYLALTHNGSLPCFISNLQKLQSLIVCHQHSVKSPRDSTYLPDEIWGMQELRHLRITGNNLPDPSIGAKLPNLLTLHVKGHSCTESVFRSVPKLKKLGIKIELQPRSKQVLNSFDHISVLEELESLKCVVVNPRLRSQVVAPPRSFPKTLRKLSLNGIGYPWDYISAIGLLPQLQVLKIRRSAFRGPKWEIKSEEFPKLEFLLLEDIDLVHWTNEDDGCFPRLRRLTIRHCYKLHEIPLEIGAIPTLEKIEVVECSPSVVASVKQIKEDDEENGNDGLQVPINLSWDL